MRKIRIASIVMVLVLFVGFVSIASAGGSQTETRDGLTATLRLTPEKKMVDLFLKDASTGEEIRGAEVDAVVTLPDGTEVYKDLMGMKMGGMKMGGMKMGGEFSYMNSLDMRHKGVYGFEVHVKSGGRKWKFRFEQRVD